MSCHCTALICLSTGSFIFCSVFLFDEVFDRDISIPVVSIFWELFGKGSSNSFVNYSLASSISSFASIFEKLQSFCLGSFQRDPIVPSWVILRPLCMSLRATPSILCLVAIPLNSCVFVLAFFIFHVHHLPVLDSSLLFTEAWCYILHPNFRVLIDSGYLVVSAVIMKPLRWWSQGF